MRGGVIRETACGLGRNLLAEVLDICPWRREGEGRRERGREGEREGEREGGRPRRSVWRKRQGSVFSCHPVCVLDAAVGVGTLAAAFLRGCVCLSERKWNRSEEGGWRRSMVEGEREKGEEGGKEYEAERGRKLGRGRAGKWAGRQAGGQGGRQAGREGGRQAGREGGRWNGRGGEEIRQ